MSRLTCVGTFFVIAACKRGEPPMPNIDAAVSPLPPPSGAAAPQSSSPVAVASGAPATPATASAEPTTEDAGATVEATADAGVDPATLPQTRDKPAASGAAFEARTAALFRGVVEDDPDVAMPFFFPLEAYKQVKDVGNPAGDWRARLVGNYKRDIHGLHEKLGRHAADAKLVRVEVPEGRAKWVEPGDEYNKIGYWRVYSTRFVYEVDGKERTFDVSSLISWRGEWFVVHLTGFK